MSTISKVELSSDRSQLFVEMDDGAHHFDLEDKTDLVRLKRLMIAMGYEMEGIEGDVRIGLDAFVGERVRVVERNDGLVDYEEVDDGRKG